MAELAVLPGAWVERLPDSLSWEGGATVPYSALVTWGAMVWRGGLTPGRCDEGRYVKKVLIVDSCTSTGCLAVQLAAVWGASVTAVAPYRVVPLAHALGAQAVVVAPEAEDPVGACRAELQQAGPFDLVVMTSSLLPTDLCQSLLAPYGRLTSTQPPHLSSDGWGCVRRWLLPAWRRLFSAPHLPAPSRLTAPLRHVGRLVGEGRLQPVLDTVFSTGQLREALQQAANEEAVGKSVVVFN